MSVNSLLDSGNPAESWKALRVSSLVVDNDFSLGTSAQNALSLWVNSINANSASQDITISNLISNQSSNIPPVGINYVANNVTVDVTGYYLVTGKLECTTTLVISSINTFTFKLYNDTDSTNVLVDETKLSTSTPVGTVFNTGFSAVVKLIQGKNYNFSIDQVNTTTISIGANAHSYVSIIKLF